MPLAPGTRLGAYEVLSPLGAGGMGEVYRAKQLSLGREVAIKVLPEHLARDADARARLEREASAIAALSHPNILAIHDFASDGGISFAVMELLAGATLRSRLSAPIPWRKAVELGIEIADGLAAAHVHGIVHRDLKPENIFITDSGHAKILDFGLARSRPPGLESDPNLSPTLTAPGTLVGTIAYMPPEQLRGHDVGPTSDIFSFGCVLYEMVAGQRAFAGTTAADTISAILNEDPGDVSGRQLAIPLALLEVIRHCLEKSVSERFQSARDLAFALRTIARYGAATIAPQRSLVRTWGLAAGVSVLLLGSSALLVVSRSDQPRSLAVLPFAAAPQDPETRFLGDRITESLIKRLSRTPGLKVKSRTSVERFRGADADPGAAGAALAVEAVLAGRVHRDSERLTISAELLDARDGSHMWGEQYTRKTEDLLAVQEEIFRGVLQKLRLSFRGDEQRELEAHRLYMEGRDYWSTRTQAGLRKSIGLFEQAIARQPDFALAHAGLADSHNMLAAYGAVAPREAFPKARSAAEQALRLDDSIAQAHAALAYTRHRFDWDWPGAELEFHRSIDIGGYGPARQWHSNYLASQGRLQEAVAEARRGQELDPLSLIVTSHLGFIYYFSRRYDESIEQSRKTLRTDPDFYPGHRYLGMAYEQKGRNAEAIDAFQKAVTLSGGSVLMKAHLAHAMAVTGRAGEARQILDELKGVALKGYLPPYYFALIHTGLNDPEQAFRWLDNAVEDRSDWCVFLGVDPRFDRLRSHARFKGILKRIGLGE
jgi:serine/threonine-protein kinase